MENGEILAGQSNGELGLIESTETALPFKLSRFQANWIRPGVELRYVFRDEQIEGGENYYRLKLTGTDHSVDYSDFVRILVPDTTNSLAFYRASTREIILHPETISEKEALSLYTIHGNWVMQVPGGSKSIAAGHLAGGIYILVVNTGKGRVLQKLRVY